MDDAVLYEVDGRIAVITVNRPEARNAVNGDVARGIEAAVDALEADDDVHVAVLRATPSGSPDRPVFCAGADLKALREPGKHPNYTERGGFAGFVFRERTKPVVGAVDGLAVAGGLEILLACDLIVASTRAEFGLVEVTRNVIAAAGGLFRLPRLIGQPAAMDMILTGTTIGARRAYDLGMVSRLVEPGMAFDEALVAARQIAEAAPLAVRASRRVVRAAAGSDDETLQAWSQQLLAEVMASEDTAEGLAAFVEKRPPQWKGR